MPRILLVEDEMLVRVLAHEDLTDAGFEVIDASDGDEALAVLRADQGFDLLLTDIKLPGGLDGHELAEHARQLIPGLKVIYASGLADSATAHDGGRYLAKPYRRETLLALIGELGLAA